MMLIARIPLALSPPPMKYKPRVTLSYLTPMVYIKASKRSVVSFGIQTHFKGNSTIKNLLVSLKDKDPMANSSGAIYLPQCGDLACDEEYISETSRTFGERFKEHLKAPSSIHNHSYNTGHTTTQDNFQIIGREDHDIARAIEESIYNRVNNPTLNRNIAKFNLHHIWNRVFLNTPILEITRKLLGLWHS